MIRRSVVAVLVALLTAGTSVACGNDRDTHLTNRTDRALPGNYGGNGPGVLKSAQPLSSVDPRLNMLTSLSARFTYTTALAASDEEVEASATVFVPKVKAPQGGWRVVALGHDDVGIHPECAPSGSPDLLGLVGSVRALVGAGYVVTVPDYVGLGIHGKDLYHPYLDSTTAAYSMIDAVRATRKLVPETSGNWIAVGNGQGGQAAWAVNELTADYGGELTLKGALALTPLASLEWLTDAAAGGTLNNNQQLMLLQYLTWLPIAYPDFPIDDFRRGAAKAHWDELSACWGAAAKARPGLARSLGPRDVGPATPAATERLRGFLRKTSLPQGPTIAPMLVTADQPDGLIPTAQTAAAVDRACAMGDVIDFVTPPPDPDLMGWVADRFNDVPAPDTCGNAADPAPAAPTPGATPTTAPAAPAAATPTSSTATPPSTTTPPTTTMTAMTPVPTTPATPASAAQAPDAPEVPSPVSPVETGPPAVGPAQ